MTDFQRIVKYMAIALAAVIIVSIIGGIFALSGALGGFIFDGTVDKDMKSYTVGNDINDLYIDIGAADFQIKCGEAISVESNLKHLEVSDSGSKLTVKQSGKLGRNYNGAKLVITLPENKNFDSIVLKTGAGTLNIDTLSAKRLNCDFGAGEINISNLFVSERADIDGGAGEINIAGGSISNLDFDMGVGKLNFTAVLTGSCKLDLGVGESNITLIGNKDDYSFDIDKGIGSITVDGKTVSDAGGFGNGQNRVEISGGIGAINLSFK